MNGLAYYQLLKYIPILYEYILLLLGCERFSDYGGYGDTFFWKGRHDDKSIRWDELKTTTLNLHFILIVIIFLII